MTVTTDKLVRCLVRVCFFYNHAKCVYNNWQEALFFRNGLMNNALANWTLLAEMITFFTHSSFYKVLRTLTVKFNFRLRSFLSDVPLITVLLLQSKWVKRSWATCTLTVRRSREPERGWVQQMPRLLPHLSALTSVCETVMMLAVWHTHIHWQSSPLSGFPTHMPYIQYGQFLIFDSYVTVLLQQISYLNCGIGFSVFQLSSLIKMLSLLCSM